MPVNNISQHIIKPSTATKFVTHLNKAGVLLPVIMLESTVTGGRTYQAYKRGGYTEARERLCEETTGAVFWLAGVKVLNDIGDKIGKKYLGIEEPTFSLAKDEVRRPFENMVRDKGLEKSQKFLIGFKFTKIATAVALASGIMGFVVPRINQKITRQLMKADKKKSEKQQLVQNSDNIQTQVPAEKTVSANEEMKNFLNEAKAKKPSFGRFSVDTFATITNNLENHDIYKLLATDSGTLTGRAYNARNKDERIEILIRDGGSIYFYLRCKDDVINFLNKRDGFGGNISKLNPKSATALHNMVIKKLEEKGSDGKMSVDEARKFMLGSNPEQVEKTVSKFNFKKGDVIALEDFSKMASGAGVEVTEEMLKKASLMAELQPERMRSDLGYESVGKILTKAQVKDILNDGVVSEPEFLKTVMSEHFGTDLTAKYKFIPKGKIETFRDNLDGYAKSIIQYAEKHKLNEVTPEVMKEVNNINFRKNAIHIASGLGVSALFLSTLIPKFQYFVTKYRTGSDAFPGVKDIN